MAANKTRTRKDNFISKIVKDPASPPKTILLRGYLGDSSEEGHTRLYLDAQLNNYVEIPDDAILHEEDVAKDQSPLGETYVWIKQDAQVIHGEAGPQRRKSSFFEGSIAAAAAAGPATLPFIGCPPLPTAQCTIPPGCPVLSIACPTQPLHGCPPPTPLHGCPPTPLLGCPPPTPLHGCPPLTPLHGCPPTPLHGCPPPTPLHGCPTPFDPVCPPTPGHPCPTPLAICPTPHVVCPQTPFHPCPPLTPLCPPTPFHQCLTPACPPTPIHPCPTPLCPPTPLHPCVSIPQVCFTPACPSVNVLHCPTGPLICQLTPAHGCPPLTAPPGCPILSAHGCPSVAGCPSGPACGPGPGPFNP